MEEWKEEREQLLTSAEQTHAYCQSLAFQVRSHDELLAWRHAFAPQGGGGGGGQDENDLAHSRAVRLLR